LAARSCLLAALLPFVVLCLLRPEALIPIMKGSQRVVLVGDHKQLPPVIKSRQAEEGGLGKSLFERLMHLGAPSAMLQVGYNPTNQRGVLPEVYHRL